MSYEQLEKRLIALYDTVESIDEQTPDGIMLPFGVIQKLDLHREILHTIGDLHAIAHGQVKWYEFRKKEAYAEAYLEVEGRPVKEREQLAVIESNTHRREMAKWDRVAMKWQNRYKTTEHVINALKWKIRDAHHTDNGGQ